jgi:hypothetical protein
MVGSGVARADMENLRHRRASRCKRLLSSRKCYRRQSVRGEPCLP